MAKKLRTGFHIQTVWPKPQSQHIILSKDQFGELTNNIINGSVRDVWCVDDDLIWKDENPSWEIERSNGVNFGVYAGGSYAYGQPVYYRDALRENDKYNGNNRMGYTSMPTGYNIGYPGIYGINLDEFESGFFCNFWTTFYYNTQHNRNESEVCRFDIDGKSYALSINRQYNTIRLKDHENKIFLAEVPFSRLTTTLETRNCSIGIDANCNIKFQYSGAAINYEFNNNFSNLENLYCFPSSLHGAHQMTSFNWAVNDGSGDADNYLPRPIITIPFNPNLKLNSNTNFQVPNFPATYAERPYSIWLYRAKVPGAIPNNYNVRLSYGYNHSGGEDIKMVESFSNKNHYFDFQMKGALNTMTQLEVANLVNNAPGNNYIELVDNANEWPSWSPDAIVSWWHGHFEKLRYGCDASDLNNVFQPNEEVTTESEFASLSMDIDPIDYDDISMSYIDEKIFNKVDSVNLHIEGHKSDTITSSSLQFKIYDPILANSFELKSDTLNFQTFSHEQRGVMRIDESFDVAKLSETPLRLNLDLIREPVDTDGDTVWDHKDAFPNDATETVDSDGDGVGDNADELPLDPNLSTNDALYTYVSGVGYYWPVYLSTEGISDYHTHTLNDKTYYMLNNDTASGIEGEDWGHGSNMIKPGTFSLSGYQLGGGVSLNMSGNLIQHFTKIGTVPFGSAASVGIETPEAATTAGFYMVTDENSPNFGTMYLTYNPAESNTSGGTPISVYASQTTYYDHNQTEQTFGDDIEITLTNAQSAWFLMYNSNPQSPSSISITPTEGPADIASNLSLTLSPYSDEEPEFTS